MQFVMAGSIGFDPANGVLFAAPPTWMRVGRANGRRVGSQPDRETLDPETLARDLDDGAPATEECAVHWRSSVRAKVRVLTS
jgi:hypothetical protein